MNTTSTITENGEQLDVTEKERKHLVRKNLIHGCRGCSCYHLNPTYGERFDQVTWGQVELELKNFATANFAKSIKKRRTKR